MAKKPTQTRKTRKKMDTPNDTSTPRTTEQKLAAARALVAKYERELALEAIKNDIQVGDDVDFQFGRGESKRTLTGEVAGMADTDQGKVVAVSTKDDMGLPEIKKVNIRDVLVNRTADKRRAETGEAAAPGDNPLDAE